MTPEFPGPGDYTECPHCAVSLVGEPIPAEIAENYSGGHWRREIGQEIRGVYDGVLFWVCPACWRPFHRWPAESFQYRASLPYMRELAAVAARDTAGEA